MIWESKMNLVLLLAVCAWHVTTAINYATVERRLFEKYHRAQQRVVTEISKNQIRFSLKLFKASTAINYKPVKLTVIPTANLFIGLSMLYFGADGKYQQQLSNILQYSSNCSIAELAMQILVQRMKPLESNNSTMANMIFHPEKLRFMDDYRQKINRMLLSNQWHLGCKDSCDDEITEWIDSLGIKNYLQYSRGEGNRHALITASSLQTKLHFRQLNAMTHKYRVNCGWEMYRNIEYLSASAELVYGEILCSRGPDINITMEYIKVPWKGANYDKFKTIFIIANNFRFHSSVEQCINEDTIYKILSNTDMTLISVFMPKSFTLSVKVDVGQELRHAVGLPNIPKKLNVPGKMFDTSPPRSLIGPIHYYSTRSYELIADSEPLRPDGKVLKEFEADHHDMIIIDVLEGVNPIILSMTRYVCLSDPCYIHKSSNDDSDDESE